MTWNFLIFCMIELDVKKIGRRIKELRIEFEMTQEQLAGLVGVASNTITQYEKGTSKMGVDVLANLAVVLKTKTDYLLCLTDNY